MHRWPTISTSDQHQTPKHPNALFRQTVLLALLVCCRIVKVAFSRTAYVVKFPAFLRARDLKTTRYLAVTLLVDFMVTSSVSESNKFATVRALEVGPASVAVSVGGSSDKLNKVFAPFPAHWTAILRELRWKCRLFVLDHNHFGS